MKFTLSWLKEHIDFKSNINLKTIVDNLTNLGLEVESYENSADKLKGFIISEIINVQPHPNADRLSICEVNPGKKSVKVVCGAKNVKKNLKVVFAPIGTCIPSSGLILKKKDQETWNRFNKCFYCQLNFECELKEQGKWKEWVLEQEKSRWSKIEKEVRVIIKEMQEHHSTAFDTDVVHAMTNSDASMKIKKQ